MDFIWQGGQPEVSSSVICILPSQHGELVAIAFLPPDSLTFCVFATPL